MGRCKDWRNSFHQCLPIWLLVSQWLLTILEKLKLPEKIRCQVKSFWSKGIDPRSCEWLWGFLQEYSRRMGIKIPQLLAPWGIQRCMLFTGFQRFHVGLCFSHLHGNWVRTQPLLVFFLSLSYFSYPLPVFFSLLSFSSNYTICTWIPGGFKSAAGEFKLKRQKGIYSLSSHLKLRHFEVQ